MSGALEQLREDPLTIIHGDCVEVMAGMAEASVDAIVTDPPYELGFMGRGWDKSGIANDPKTWAAALRVLRPGGYLLSFGGTRTFHRMTVAIEDAGFEIRDCLMWLYGSGFPKSLDVSKAMDKAAGAEREVVGTKQVPDGHAFASEKYGRVPDARTVPVTAPRSELAKRWDGWGTALKPAWEPIVLARKPLIGTVAANVEKHGTGALNIDGSRIATSEDMDRGVRSTALGRMNDDAWKPKPTAAPGSPLGRWPANVVLDEHAAEMLDEQSGYSETRQVGRPRKPGGGGFQNGSSSSSSSSRFDSGGASRFFYTAKADKLDRGAGNTHPTVKPVDLMRWLVRLVTPPGGLVLDPFAGSGTTGQAALAEGRRCVLIEKEAEYVEGIERWRAGMQLGLGMS